MNTLWYHEMNIWDWIYRALEIKKQQQSTESGSPDLFESRNFEDNNNSLWRYDEEKSKIYEESGPFEDPDYELILESCKTEEIEKQLENEDYIIFKMIDTFKNDVLPKKKFTLKDNDVIKLISKNAQPINIPKITETKPITFLDKVTKEDDLINSIQRSIDKKLK